jgi:hypothetical protein
MVRLTHQLTEAKIRTLADVGLHHDGAGLYLQIRPGGARSYSRPKARRWINSPPLLRRASNVDRIGAGAVRLCPTRYPPKAQAERLAMAPSKFVKSRSPRTG